MSELKATTVYDAYWKANSVGEGTGILVYLKCEADKVIAELKEQHEKEMKELEHDWRARLYSREQEVALEVRKQEEHNRRVLEHMATPSTFRDDLCSVLRTCEREGSPAPAYDFLRGMNAGWWMCDKINSPPQESVEDRMRKWMNKPKEEK